MDYEEVILACACWSLVAGKHGPEQPRDVRGKLTELEARGLAHYGPAAGWCLTDAGRSLAAAARREARSRRRSKERR